MHPDSLLCTVSILATVTAGLQARGDEAEARGVQVRSVADFEGPDVLGRVTYTGPSMKVALTTQGATAGMQALEVTCLSAARKLEGGDRTVVFRLPSLLDCSNSSSLAYDVTNRGARPVAAHLSCYNEGANSDWGYDGGGGTVPPGATQTIRVDLLRLGRALQPMLDVSRVVALAFSAAQQPDDDVVICVDNVRLELDPALGSPTSHLRARAKSLLEAYRQTVARVPWEMADPVERSELERVATTITGRVAEVVAACEKAEREGGFAGTYHSVNARLHDTQEANEIGRLLLLGKPAFYCWQLSPYVNILPGEVPAPDSAAVGRLDVAMAGGEYRDVVFMVSANAHADQQIEVSLETGDETLRATALVQEVLYLRNAANQIVGGAHYRLEGPLAIPRGESRQLRLRFDATHGGLLPGSHDFALRLRDAQHSCEQVIPGTVQVWDFALPEPAAIMSNNTYSEFAESSLADLADLMVKDMKAYGLNAFMVHPRDVTVAQPEGGLRFDLAKLDEYVGLVMANWGDGPGPQFIFSLGYGIMPSEDRLGQWVNQFRAVVEKHGVRPKDWYFVFGDEADEAQLLSFETPLGETMRRAAPGARISTNTSAVISGPLARERHAATIDRWEPDLDVVKMNPDLLPALRATGKPIALFRCRGAYSVRGANMYNYYRVYGWEAAVEGCVGMGLWTYCVDRHKNPWADREEQFVLVFRHPTKRDLVHSRRYETFREGIDDYRYVRKLRDVARARSPQAQAEAEQLIGDAVTDITADVTDTSRCGKWRLRIAERILRLQGPQDEP